jgi:hypothetical protein
MVAKAQVLKSKVIRTSSCSIYFKGTSRDPWVSVFEVTGSYRVAKESVLSSGTSEKPV